MLGSLDAAAPALSLPPANRGFLDAASAAAAARSSMESESSRAFSSAAKKTSTRPSRLSISFFTLRVSFFHRATTISSWVMVDVSISTMPRSLFARLSIHSSISWLASSAMSRFLRFITSRRSLPRTTSCTSPNFSKCARMRSSVTSEGNPDSMTTE